MNQEKEEKYLKFLETKRDSHKETAKQQEWGAMKKYHEGRMSAFQEARRMFLAYQHQAKPYADANRRAEMRMS